MLLRSAPSLLLLSLLPSPGHSVPSARQQYDSMSLLVSGSPYPSVWWEEREACMAALSPSLASTMDQAWAGLAHYWTTRGDGDYLW